MSTDKFESILNTLVIPQDKIKGEYFDALSNAILEICPSTLFRYRSCNERNIGAFDENLIYAVHPNKFNDVYDSLPCYNKEHVQGINQIYNLSDLVTYIQSEKVRSMLRSRGYEVGDFTRYADENVYSLLNDLSDLYAVDIQYVMRESVHVACFSEIIDSVIMWSHYAQNHEGFALEYDLKPILIEKRQHGELLMPIIYSDERCDATQFYLWAILRILGKRIPNPNMLNMIKALLYKSKSWEYEKEWRLMLTEHSKEKVVSTSLRPIAIYYGARISKIHRKILHNIAKEKGLEEYDMSVNNTSNEYKMEYVKA